MPRRTIAAISVVATQMVVGVWLSVENYRKDSGDAAIAFHRDSIINDQLGTSVQRLDTVTYRLARVSGLLYDEMEVDSQRFADARSRMKGIFELVDTTSSKVGRLRVEVDAVSSQVDGAVETISKGFESALRPIDRGTLSLPLTYSINEANPRFLRFADSTLSAYYRKLYGRRSRWWEGIVESELTRTEVVRSLLSSYERAFGHSAFSAPQVDIEFRSQSHGDSAKVVALYEYKLDLVDAEFLTISNGKLHARFLATTHADFGVDIPTTFMSFSSLDDKRVIVRFSYGGARGQMNQRVSAASVNWCGLSFGSRQSAYCFVLSSMSNEEYLDSRAGLQVWTALVRQVSSPFNAIYFNPDGTLNLGQ